MKHFYLYLMVIIGIMFLNGCSKDDDNIEQTKTEVVLPKEVYRLQIVEAKFSEPLSSQEEYNGNLGGTPIKLVRADEHTLFFYIPGDITVGEMVLTVPQLDVSHTFNVKNPTLKGNAEMVLHPIFEKTTPEHQEILTPEYAGYLTTVNNAFNDYYKTLSQEEKNDMALFYQVNETFFADVLNADLQEAKGVKQTVIIATKFTLATAFFVGGSMTLTLPGTPVEKAIIGIASVTAAVKAWDYGKALINQVKVITKVEDDFSMDKPLPKTLGSSNLTFENDKTRGVNLYTKQRNMISGDRASAASGLAKFFGTYEELMNVTKKVNSIVSFINDHVFFVNIPSIPISEIPNSTETETTALTEEAFGYMTFSVADSNVKITESKFENGTIRMKMTILNPATVTGNSIKTQLNYTYKEEFSNVSGSFPIEVELEEEYNYQLQIGDYNPDYNLITPQQTLNQGQSVSFPNYMVQMVRLLLDGQPVNVGQHGLPWVQIPFGITPVSGASINDQNYTFTVYDHTNNRNVTFHLNLTLTNQAYSQLVGKTLEIGSGTIKKYVTFNSNGTCTSVFGDGSNGVYPTSYQWFGSVISPSYEDCSAAGGNGIITTKIIGVVYLPEGNSVTVPNYILIEEGGTFRANSFYGCSNTLNYIPVQ